MKACDCAEYAIVPLRLAIALVFIYHGLSKLLGMSGVIGFFDSVGIPVPGFTAYLVALVELVGGIAILIGLWTRIFAGLLAIVMAVAFFAVKLPNGFFAGEFDLVLLLVLVSLMMTGAGKWSVMDGCCMCQMSETQAPAKQTKKK